MAAATVYGQTIADLSSDVVDRQSLSEEQQAALAALLDDPVDLNSARAGDLWFLRPAVATAVLEARLTGAFTGWPDLANRTRLPAETLAGLRAVAYLSASRAGELSTRLVSGSTGERIRSRWRYKQGPWQALGASMHQPGEFQLADHFGLSLARSGEHFQAVLGGYRLTWGLGLVLAKDFPRPVGPALLGTTPLTSRMRPSFSTTASDFMQGIGGLYQRGPVQLAGGYSFRQADISASQGIARVVTSRTNTQLGLTASERLPFVGGSLALAGWELGGLAAGYQLRPTAKTAAVDKKYYSATVRRILAYHASELDLAHESGWQAGLTASISRLSLSRTSAALGGRGKLTVLHRRYPPGWEPVRGRLTGQRVSRGNETGWFIGWSWRTTPFSMNGYFDSYQQTAATLPGAGAGQGRENGWEAIIRRGAVEGRILLREEDISKGGSFIDSAGLATSSQSRSARSYQRVALTTKFGPKFRLRVMAARQNTTDDYQADRGETFGLTVRYRHGTNGFNSSWGAYTFNTDGWDQRIYIYEDGLPGEFALHPLAGQGWGWFCRISRQWGRGSIGLRARQQWKYNDQTAKTEAQPGQYGLQLEVAL